LTAHTRTEDNIGMSTDMTIPTAEAIPPEHLADLEAVVAAVSAGRKPDPELACRVRERAETFTNELRRKHGEMEIAVDLIREARDEE
jgi:hypothetical protein